MGFLNKVAGSTTLIGSLFPMFGDAGLPVKLTEETAFVLIKEDLKVFSELRFQPRSKFYLSHFGNAETGPADYVSQRIKKFSWSSSEPQNVIAFAYTDGELVITPQYDYHSSLLARLATLVHEASHMDKKTPLHIWCPKPYAFRMNP